MPLCTQPCQSLGTDGTVADEIKRVLTSDLAKMAQAMVDALSERLAPPDDEYHLLRAMRMCLDLRKMITDTAYFSEARAQASLQRLYNWMATRATVFDEGAEKFKPMPTFVVVWSQCWWCSIWRLRTSSKRAWRKWKYRARAQRGCLWRRARPGRRR